MNQTPIFDAIAVDYLPSKQPTGPESKFNALGANAPGYSVDHLRVESYLPEQIAKRSRRI